MRIEGKSEDAVRRPDPDRRPRRELVQADGGLREDLAEHPCDGINPLDPENTTPGATPTAASVDAMNLIGETTAMAGQWYPGLSTTTSSRSWGPEAENAEAEVVMGRARQQRLHETSAAASTSCAHGDEVLWIYNAFDSRPFLALFAASEHYSSGTRPLTAKAELDQPFEVEVARLRRPRRKTSRPPTPERTSKTPQPYEGADVSPVPTIAKGFETVETESPEPVTTNAKARPASRSPHRVAQNQGRPP